MTREEIERRIKKLDVASAQQLDKMYNENLSAQEREDATASFHFMLGELYILKMLLEKGE